MAEVVWRSGDKRYSTAVWYCNKCGVAKAWTNHSAEQAAQDHVCPVVKVEYWSDGEHYLRTIRGGRPEIYGHGWEALEKIDGLPFELCNSYYSPANGHPCDLPKDHDGNHHV